ncbi:MAG: hypothetical protein JSV49_02965 [Thermoplasmata archaeon]|nr:MAG: hypothetical protein JSV49_02965 [Thermoplasmata archaeon]
MNRNQIMALSTGFIFIVVIIILAIAGVNNLILALVLLGVIAGLSGTVKVLLLAEKRKEVHEALEEFRKIQDKQVSRRPVKTERFEYYCPLCLRQSHKFEAECSECGKSALRKSKNLKK